LSEIPLDVQAIVFLDRPAMPDIGRMRQRIGSVVRLGPETQDANAFIVPCNAGTLIGALVDRPLPEAHWIDWVRKAWWWPDGVQRMAGNGAHLILHAKWAGETALNAHINHALIVREILEQLPAIAVWWGSVFVSTDQFKGEFHRMHSETRVPVRLWVLIQTSSDGQGGTIASTLGMDKFGLMEIEANSAPLNAADTMAFIEGVAGYIMSKGPIVHDGDTVGSTQTQFIRVHHAPSFRDPGQTVYQLQWMRRADLH
jgi:hypothetical protein